MISPLPKETFATDHGTFDLSWTEHAIGNEKCLRLKVKIGRSFKAIPLLESAEDWVFVWRGRDDGFLTLAIDARLVVNEADRMKVGRDPSLQWFGGETFLSEGSSDWGDLRHGLWFLPAITWKLA